MIAPITINRPVSRNASYKTGLRKDLDTLYDSYKTSEHSGSGQVVYNILKTLGKTGLSHSERLRRVNRMLNSGRREIYLDNSAKETIDKALSNVYNRIAKKIGTKREVRYTEDVLRENTSIRQDIYGSLPYQRESKIITLAINKEEPKLTYNETKKQWGYEKNKVWCGTIYSPDEAEAIPTPKMPKQALRPEKFNIEYLPKPFAIGTNRLPIKAKAISSSGRIVYCASIPLGETILPSRRTLESKFSFGNLFAGAKVTALSLLSYRGL